MGSIIISIFQWGSWYFKNLCCLPKVTQLTDNDARIQTQVIWPRRVWAPNHHTITPETQLKSTLLSLRTNSPIFPTFRISTLLSIPPFFKNTAAGAHQSLLSLHTRGWCSCGPGSYTRRDVWFPTDYCYNSKFNTFLGSSARGSHLPVMGERAGLCIWEVPQLLALLSLCSHVLKPVPPV